jgi:hypothetical protein
MNAFSPADAPNPGGDISTYIPSIESSATTGRQCTSAAQLNSPGPTSSQGACVWVQHSFRTGQGHCMRCSTCVMCWLHASVGTAEHVLPRMTYKWPRAPLPTKLLKQRRATLAASAHHSSTWHTVSCHVCRHSCTTAAPQLHCSMSNPPNSSHQSTLQGSQQSYRQCNPLMPCVHRLAPYAPAAHAPWRVSRSLNESQQACQASPIQTSASHTHHCTLNNHTHLHPLADAQFVVLCDTHGMCNSMYGTACEYRVLCSAL